MTSLTDGDTLSDELANIRAETDWEVARAVRSAADSYTRDLPNKKRAGVVAELAESMSVKVYSASTPKEAAEHFVSVANFAKEGEEICGMFATKSETLSAE